MRIIPLLLALLLVSPAFGAEAPALEQKNSDSETAANATAPVSTRDFTCKYYSVKLADGWKAIVAPEETLGSINAIFATDTGSTVVTMVAGPSGGEDAQTIAAMFAEQFKAQKQPTLKNGQYTFQFPIQNTVASAWVSVYDGIFMMSYIAGNTRQGLKFIRDCIRSDNYPGLLPQ